MIPIIMLIVGIIGLVKGRISVTRTREIRRPASVFISLLFLVPLPSVFIMDIWVATAVPDANGDRRPNLEEWEETFSIVAVIIMVVCFKLALILCFALAKPKEVVKKSVDHNDDAPRKKREYDDEDDRPRRRPSRNDD